MASDPTRPDAVERAAVKAAIRDYMRDGSMSAYAAADLYRDIDALPAAAPPDDLPPCCSHVRETAIGGSGCILRKGHQSLHYNGGALYWDHDGKLYVPRGSVLDSEALPASPGLSEMRERLAAAEAERDRLREQFFAANNLLGNWDALYGTNTPEVAAIRDALSPPSPQVEPPATAQPQPARSGEEPKVGPSAYYPYTSMTKEEAINDLARRVARLEAKEARR